LLRNEPSILNPFSLKGERGHTFRNYCSLPLLQRRGNSRVRELGVNNVLRLPRKTLTNNISPSHKKKLPETLKTFLSYNISYYAQIS
jgi:hypothetical protein